MLAIIINVYLGLFAAQSANVCGGYIQTADPAYSAPYQTDYTWTCAGDNDRD